MSHDILNSDQVSSWYSSYHDSYEVQRRKQAMPKKLNRLEIDSAPKDSTILDMCCGYGECLDTLNSIGFKNLYGIDLELNPEFAKDKRFHLIKGDSRQTGLDSEKFDYILNIHAMHHLGQPDDIKIFRDECYRLLKPGGKMLIIDFDNSFLIRLAFWTFRTGLLNQTRYLRYMTGLIKSEWTFLKDYLPQWHAIEGLWLKGPFNVKKVKKDLFYFHWILEKPQINRSRT